MECNYLIENCYLVCLEYWSKNQSSLYTKIKEESMSLIGSHFN